MLTLYIGPRLPGVPNASPFCTKLETWLRVAGVPHTVAPWTPFVAPKGKMPSVRVDGALMGDSQLIIEHLERTRGASLDAHLSPAQAATSRLIRRTLEEGTYFALVPARWLTDAGFAVVRAHYFNDLPTPIRQIFPWIARSGVRSSMQKQGSGRHPMPVLVDIGAADLRAIATILGDQPYLFGDAPTLADCVLYAFWSTMVETVAMPWANLRDELPNLAAHHDRIRARWFPELAP